jgi:hypothetical protein
MLQDQHLDFGGVAEIRNALFQNLAATTGLTKSGMLGYNSTDNHFYGHNGTEAKRLPWTDDIELIQSLAAAPTGAALVAGKKWYDTAANSIKYYDGTATKTIATADQISSMFRIRSTAFSAATGALPVASDNNVTALAGLALAQGDTFLVAVGGTLVGVGGDDLLEPGDMLVLMDATAPTVAASWWGFQTNASIPANVTAFENVAVSLTANANATATVLVLTGLDRVEFYDGTGAKRPFVDISFAQGAKSATLNSIRAIAGGRAFCLGTAAPPPTTAQQPSIGAITVTAQAGNLVTLSAPVTMAGGIPATSLRIDLFDATDTAFATPLAPQQLITTGIAPGAVLNVGFTNVNGFNGVTPLSFVIRAEVS